MGELLLKRKMVSSLTERTTFKKDTSIQELVDRIGLAPVLLDYLTVTLNGNVIPKDDWVRVIATPKNIVRVTVVPAGGGDGKNPLAVIAIIALTVYTGGLGTSLAAGGMSAYGVAAIQVGIMFVGAMAIQAIFPPTLPSSAAGMADDSSGFFGITGMRNQLRLNGAIRSVYGTMKVAPDIAANPYVITSGDIQTLYMLFDFGYGDIEVDDIRIGSTAFSAYGGKPPIVHRNYTDGDLTLYKNRSLSEQHAVELESSYGVGAVVVQRTAPSKNSNEVTLEIQFPMGLNYIDTSGNMQEQSVIFYINYEKTDGTTGLLPVNTLDVDTSHPAQVSDTIDGAWGFAPAIQFLDFYTRVPVMTGHYRDTQGYSTQRGGDRFSVTTTGQIFIGQSFTINSIEYTITSAVESHTSHPAQVIGVGYWDIHLDKAIPSSTHKIYDTWQMTTNNIFTGPWFHAWVAAPMSSLLKQNATNFLQLTRATKEPFVFTVTATMPSIGEWRIHLSRSLVLYTQEKPSGRLVTADKTVLTTITSAEYEKPLAFTKPHTIVEIEITATKQLGGMVDNLNAMCRRNIRVWDGAAFVLAFTTNPAWIALDILTGDVNPDKLSDARLNLQSFKDWAVFCDILKMDSDGISRPQYQASCNWDGESTVYARLQSVMSVGRATLSVRENLFTIIFENFPTVPVQLITPMNSWNFTSTKAFIKIPDGLKVKFIDPTSSWQMVDRIVYNDGFDENNAYYFETIASPLCTSSDQAWREGRYQLAQGKLRPESFSVMMDIENIIAERGDLVQVQHDVARMGGTPARVNSISGRDITLDHDVLWTATKVYALRIRYDDGTQEEVPVVNQDSTGMITLGVDAPKLNVGDLVVFGVVDFVTDEYLIKAITPSSDITALIELIPIARDIVNADTGAIPDYTPPITQDEVSPMVTGVSGTPHLYYNYRYPYVDFMVKWESLGNNFTYEVWMATEGNYYRRVGETADSEFLVYDKKSTLDLDYFGGKDIDIKVVSINTLGDRPAFNDLSVFTVKAPFDDTAPDKPLFLAGNVNKNIMQLNWFPPEDEDIGGYILKFTPDLETPKWEESGIETDMISHSTTEVEVNARVGSYLLKTIDTSSNESVEFALVRTTIPSLDEMNLIETVIEHPDFDGAYSLTEKKDALIQLEKEGSNYHPVGTYNFHKVVDVGGIHTCWLAANVSFNPAGDVFVAAWLPVADVDPVAATLTSGSAHGEQSSVLVEVRSCNLLTVMADWTPAIWLNDGSGKWTMSDTSSTVWSGWQQFTAGFYTGRHFQFRAVLATSNRFITPRVKELSVEVDMPDRTVGEHNVPFVIADEPTGVKFVPFPDGAFKEVPTVVVTEDFASPSDFLVIGLVTQEGFEISYMHGNHEHDGQFDYLAKGYGKIRSEALAPILFHEEDDLNLLPSAIGHLSRRDILS